VSKTVVAWKGALQIPPLRFAPVGMTKERVAERGRTVAKGQGGCWGGTPFPSTTAVASAIYLYGK
jgi:hypothetical protein